MLRQDYDAAIKSLKVGMRVLKVLSSQTLSSVLPLKLLLLEILGTFKMWRGNQNQADACFKKVVRVGLREGYQGVGVSLLLLLKSSDNPFEVAKASLYLSQDFHSAPFQQHHLHHLISHLQSLHLSLSCAALALQLLVCYDCCFICIALIGCRRGVM